MTRFTGSPFTGSPFTGSPFTGSRVAGKRFLRFNGVGVIGFGVQLGVLAWLLHLRLHYLLATAAAVEAAVLHNFLWHERWTWKDRPGDRRARVRRLWRFHALNGLVSLGGNLVLMRTLVGTLDMPPILANLVAVLACAVLNFMGSDRLVFGSGTAGSGMRDLGCAMRDKGCRIRD